MKPKPPPCGDKHHHTGTAAFQLRLKKHQSCPPGWCDTKKGKIQATRRCPVAISSAFPMNWFSSLPGKNSTDLLASAERMRAVAQGKHTGFHPIPFDWSRQRVTGSEPAGSLTHTNACSPLSCCASVPPGCSPQSQTCFPRGTTGQTPHPSAGSGPCGNPTGLKRSRREHKKPRRGVKHKLRARGVPSVLGLYGAGAARQCLLHRRLPAGPEQGSPFAAEKATWHPLSFPYNR